MFKKEIRIIAWDDCAFSFNQRNVLLVGVIFRGGQFIDGVLSVKIKKDGLDATKRITDTIINSRHYDQLNMIMLDGITFAGLNMIDLKELRKNTKIPVIAVQRDKPNMEKFLLAMKRLKFYNRRVKIVESAGEIYKYGEIHYQKSGLTSEECEEILKLTCIRSKLPEPIRVAHLIASGLSRITEYGNESKGRA